MNGGSNTIPNRLSGPLIHGQDQTFIIHEEFDDGHEIP